MRQRAIHDLADLADPEFFAELETGIGLCVANAARIMVDVAVLAEKGSYQSAKILQNVANEETAKAMILLDAARCPRTPKDVLVRQLKYFAQHLPKGLYITVAEGRPSLFGDVQGRIEQERKQYYLDGPDGGEFAVCNYILSAREQAMYVDYIVADEARWWHDPATHHVTVFGPEDFRPARICRMVSALQAAGCFSAGALAIIAEVWRPVSIRETMTIHELRDLNEATLRVLDTKGLLKEAGQEAFGLIVNEGPYPLHSLNLVQEKVNKEELLAQRSWPS